MNWVVVPNHYLYHETCRLHYGTKRASDMTRARREKKWKHIVRTVWTNGWYLDALTFQNLHPEHTCQGSTVTRMGTV
jgi:hypothetical protein